MQWVSYRTRLCDHNSMLTYCPDNPNSPARVMAVTSLVQRLPEANIELLATLTRFLIGICDKAELNQMNVRNSKSFHIEINIQCQRNLSQHRLRAHAQHSPRAHLPPPHFLLNHIQGSFLRQKRPTYTSILETIKSAITHPATDAVPHNVESATHHE